LKYYSLPSTSERHLAAAPDCLVETARVRLLCQLVAEQLLSRAAEGNWLKADNLVECIQRWATAKSVRPSWQEGLRIGRLSEQLAFDLWALEPLRSLPRLVSFFSDDGMLDEASPFVKRMRMVCESRLLAHGMVSPPPRQASVG
jgi:hypothetical protein